MQLKQHLKQPPSIRYLNTAISNGSVVEVKILVLNTSMKLNVFVITLVSVFAMAVNGQAFWNKRTYSRCMAEFKVKPPRRGSFNLRACMETCNTTEKRNAMITLVRKVRGEPDWMGDPAFGVPGLF